MKYEPLGIPLEHTYRLVRTLQSAIAAIYEHYDEALDNELSSLLVDLQHYKAMYDIAVEECAISVAEEVLAEGYEVADEFKIAIGEMFLDLELERWHAAVQRLENSTV